MDVPPLQSPSNQQAHDKIRGYAYQCWLTVEAWLQLAPGDTLFVECAEDFASFSAAGEANVTQAKATAANLTLRSEDVAEAINHYWAFRLQSLSGKVSYSFLTTAGITTEQGDPLGGMAGLTLWQKVAVSGDFGKAEKLRHFLCTDPQASKKLSVEVLNFLNGATEEEFLAQIVKPMLWDTNHADMAGVRESIENQLATLVEEQFGGSPTHRHNLADTLFTRINTVAAAKEKLPLHRALLLSAIKQHMIPSEEAALAAVHQEVLGGMVMGASHLTTVWKFTDAVPPLGLADDYSRREPALKALVAAAGDARFVLIEGSSGMGKSTLAQIYGAAIGGHWLHFRGRDIDTVRILRGLQLLTAVIVREPGPFGLILDDLPWPEMDGSAMGVLRGLVRAARLHGARLIFTNQRAPSVVNLAAGGLAEVLMFKAPIMEQEEIVEVALRLGCPDTDKAISWAPIVVALSSGHPRLVHANLIGWKMRGWPAFSIDEFQAANESVKQTRDESQLLLAERRSEEIELLTRVSAFFGPFRREHALAIADQLERIVGASVAFENLLGPWIEPFSHDRYQLSPLLGKTLLNGTTSARAKEVHRAAIPAVISGKSVEAGDATGALLNAVLGDASDWATQLFMKFLMAPREHSAPLHSHLVWVTMYATEGQMVFTGFPAVDFMFRLLQFEVAASVAPEKADHFLALCDGLIATADSETAHCYRTMLAYSLIKTNQTLVAFERLFSAIDILKQSMADMLKEGAVMPAKLLPPELNPEGHEDESEVFVVLEIWNRAGTLDGLRSLLGTLQRSDDATREKYLEALCRVKASAIMCFDQVWLAEDKKAQRNWEPVLALFYDYLAAAEQWKSGLLAACAARGISIIHDEYQDRTSDADKALARVVSEDPAIMAIVTERRAKSAMLAKRYDEARRLFEAAMPNSPWIGFTASGTVVLYQNAGTAAGKAGNWTASAQHFFAGSEMAKNDDDLVATFGLLADAAFATWQSGDKPLAVTRLGLAFDMIPSLPDPATQLRVRRTMRFFGHLLTFLAWDGTGRSDNSPAPAVVPGMCSEARDDVNGPKLTVPDVTLQEVIYLTLVFQHLPQLPVLEVRLAAVLAGGNPLARYFGLELEARRLMRSGEFEKLFECAAAAAVATQSGRQLSAGESGSSPKTTSTEGTVPITLNHPFPIPMVLLCGLTQALLTGQDLAVIISAWRETAKGMPIGAELDIFLKMVESALAGSVDDAANGAASDSDEYVRWAHALRLLREPRLTPNFLLIATIFFTFFGRSVVRYPWLADTAKPLDKAISEQWRQACDQRFYFSSPTLFIPDIRALAGNPEGTVTHIAKLAVAAQPALSLNVAGTIMQPIRALAAGTPQDSHAVRPGIGASGITSAPS